MKIAHIDNSHKQVAPASDARGQAAPAGKGAPTSSSTPAEASAKVALSAAGSLLAAPGSTADFDAEKVARIAQAIRDGKFEVNAGAIADKLIAGAQELLTPRSH
jgi:negative regulator of flagellin synthesis FlgM